MKSSNASLWSKDFIVIIIINLLMFLGWYLFLPTLPLHAKAMGGTDSMLGWLLGATTLAAIVFRPIAGILLDSVGRKKILIGGIIILLAASVYFPFLTTVAAIIALRVLHGVGWGFASTASSTIASYNIPKEKFGEGMGYFSLSNSLTMAIAPAIGLAIIASRGFKPVSFIAAILLVLSLILNLFLKEEKKEKSIKLSFYEKNAILPSLVMFLVTTTYGAINGFLSIYSTSIGIQNIGMYFTVYAITLLISRPILGKATDKYGFSVVVYPGLLLVALTMVFLSKATSLPNFLISAFLYGIGMGALQSSLQTMAIRNSSKGSVGAANATFFTGFDGGIGAGSIIGGFIATRVGYGTMYLYFTLFAVIAALIIFIVNLSINKKSSQIR